MRINFKQKQEEKPFCIFSKKTLWKFYFEAIAFDPDAVSEYEQCAMY